MRWSHYIPIFEREVEPARDAYTRRFERELEQGVKRGSDVLQTIREEELQRKTIDKAARYWAKCRRWPLTEPVVAAHLFLRCSAALTFLREASRLHSSFDAPEERVLTWLLVDYWRLEGRAQWIFRLLSADWPAWR